MNLQTLPVGSQLPHSVLSLCKLEYTELFAEVQLSPMFNVPTNNASCEVANWVVEDSGSGLPLL